MFNGDPTKGKQFKTTFPVSNEQREGLGKGQQQSNRRIKQSPPRIASQDTKSTYTKKHTHKHNKRIEIGHSKGGPHHPPIWTMKGLIFGENTMGDRMTFKKCFWGRRNALAKAGGGCSASPQSEPKSNSDHRKLHDTFHWIHWPMNKGHPESDNRTKAAGRAQPLPQKPQLV